ncbi:MAG: endonuclease [Tissierellia bacterium]|nr:endonuclease [Tissierellia bacterium]
MSEQSLWRKVIKMIGSIFLTLLVLILLLVLYLSMTEFRPSKITSFTVDDEGKSPLKLGEQYRAVSFNIGYAGLGEEADFFMDGGKGVNPTKEEVKKNLQGIGEILTKLDGDFTLLQEIDVDSKRSFRQDQRVFLSDYLQDDQGLGAYASNFNVKFVPIPLPPIGKVDSGLVTRSKYSFNHVERISLYSPFKWPVRLANLKRCLLLTKFPIEQSDKELVLINLHLEAYDDSGGREKQTKELFEIMMDEYEKGNFVLAGGDFNQSFFDREDLPFGSAEGHWEPGRLDESLLPKDFQFLADERKLPTCRSVNIPYDPESEEQGFFLIDGYIASPNIKVESIETKDYGFKYSDHSPVVLEFQLKEE